jgi:hypothetical protein
LRPSAHHRALLCAFFCCALPAASFLDELSILVGRRPSLVDAAEPMLEDAPHPHMAPSPDLTAHAAARGASQSWQPFSICILAPRKSLHLPPAPACVSTGLRKAHNRNRVVLPRYFFFVLWVLMA